jgi:preprotein translocase subunit YajC
MKKRVSELGLVLLSMVTLVSTVSADTPAAVDTGSNMLSQGLMLAAFVAIFYFFIIKPQNKRAKAQRELITQITVGDEVMTTGGILGRIQRVSDNYFVLAVSQGVELTVQKQAVAGVLPKGTLSKI